MTLRGGEKIAGKWAHLKAAEEGRIRLDYECREKGETMKKKKKKERQASDVFFTLRKQTALLLLQRET